jgi:hypothetical protein
MISSSSQPSRQSIAVFFMDRGIGLSLDHGILLNQARDLHQGQGRLNVIEEPPDGRRRLPSNS